MTDTLTVQIPEDVRDNSETVTDYAFMRHRSPGRGMITVKARDNNLHWYARGVLKGTVYSWLDMNPDGQRCRFDMVVRTDGVVVHLFHTEYFTRVVCRQAHWCGGHSYATHYVATADGLDDMSDPVPLCDEDRRALERSLAGTQTTLHLSEHLHIGQH